MTDVRDIMSTELVVVSPQLSLRDLVDLLAQREIGGAPVVAEGKLLGVITLDDIVSFQASLPPVPTENPEADEDLPVEGDEAVSAYFVDFWADEGAELPERAAALRGPEWDVLSEHSVEEAMTRRVEAVSPADPVDAAARRMQAAGIHRLLVVENGQLQGIITSADLTRALAEGRTVSSS